MASPTEEFFGELGRREYIPQLGKTTGTVRIELVDDECTRHWYFRINQGKLLVSRENLEADSVVRSRQDVFDHVAAGEMNMMAAVLRGEVSVEGQLPLLTLFERVIPEPPSSGCRGRVSDQGVGS